MWNTCDWSDCALAFVKTIVSSTSSTKNLELLMLPQPYLSLTLLLNLNSSLITSPLFKFIFIPVLLTLP